MQLDPETSAQEIIPLSQASEGEHGADGNDLFFTRLPFQGSSTKRYRGGTAQNLWRFTRGDEEAVPCCWICCDNVTRLCPFCWRQTSINGASAG